MLVGILCLSFPSHYKELEGRIPSAKTESASDCTKQPFSRIAGQNQWCMPGCHWLTVASRISGCGFSQLYLDTIGFFAPPSKMTETKRVPSPQRAHTLKERCKGHSHKQIIEKLLSPAKLKRWTGVIPAFCMQGRYSATKLCVLLMRLPSGFWCIQLKVVNAVF